ncbi:MAG TPA: PEP-CTERM sorting domain-containing protein [Gammaproteobacteria bacterium]|nr:PEP-CTERM sorting domain-containing protein [Gammaproteobacteria bacterium]
MKRSMRLLKLSVIYMLFFWFTPAHAYRIYFGEDLNGSSTLPLSSFPGATAAQSSFLALINTPTIEDFEGFSDGKSGPLTITFPDLGDAILTGDGLVRTIESGKTNGLGRYATSGTNYWSVVTSNTKDKGFEIKFDVPIAAFGFHGIDIGDAGGRLALSLFNGDEPVSTFSIGHTVSNKANGAVFYYGLIATTPSELFTRVSFSLIDTKPGDNVNDGFAFDDMTIATAHQVRGIPEPASLSLMLAGWGGLLWRRHKNRIES